MFGSKDSFADWSAGILACHVAASAASNAKHLESWWFPCVHRDQALLSLWMLFAFEVTNTYLAANV
jgi:hypothetical protein